MTDFFDFLKNPIYNITLSKPNYYHFLNLLLFYILSVVMLGILAYIISQIFGITHNKIGLPFLTKILVGFLLAPIYEEILFRSLFRFNRVNITLFIVILILFVAYAIVKEAPVSFMVSSIILVAIISIITILPIETISRYIVKNIKNIFYLTSILFGLFHTMNFTGNIWLIITFSIFLCGPQIVAGLILGYIRLKYGLVYAIIFHMLINSSMLLAP